MSIPKEERIPAHPPVAEDFLSQEPRRVILMTPLMSTLGAMLVFLVSAVVAVVVLPTVTYSPPPSPNWAPFSDEAMAGRAHYLANGCLYCHSGYTRPQDYFNGLYYTYPRVSEPGDFWIGSPSPNLFGTARTGPDLSQEGGQHPDGWHRAHYWSPRATTPLSIMPRWTFLADQQITEMIAFSQSSGGKEGYLRAAAVHVGNMMMRVNGGALDPAEAFPDLVQQLQDEGTFVAAGQGMDKSPSGLPWKLVWHMNSFDRDYWLADNPLPLTQQNLLAGKAIFLERCSGCHGRKGDGKGPAAQFLAPKPFDFTSKAQMINWPGSSDGILYHRILTAGPGTAMENFGTRLRVEDTWRVVLFLRTIVNGGLTEAVPTTEMYVDWTPPPPMLNYIDNHPISNQDAGPNQDNQIEPFMDAARWVAPGMAPGDEILVGGKLPMTLERLAGLIEANYYDHLRTAYQEQAARGEQVPPQEQVMSVEGIQWHAP